MPLSHTNGKLKTEIMSVLLSHLVTLDVDHDSYTNMVTLLSIEI
jgi:hypothetical protein